jgi:predicted small lipoprotein YifL
MRFQRVTARLALAAIIGAAGIAGCGLKGPLTLPEKSGNVVVRDKASATGAAGTSARPGQATKPGTPAAPPPAPPVPERLPPPELPPSSNGTSR